MLTASKLMEILSYDPSTGLFRWIVCKHKKQLIGSVAGTRHPKGSTRIIIEGRGYYAHRLAWLYMTGGWPKDQIDHIDRDNTNNKFDNLREADNSQNCSNVIAKRNNKSGYKWVSYVPRLDQFVAQVSHNRQVRYIGSYSDPLTAYGAAVAVAAMLHGPFTRFS